MNKEQLDIFIYWMGYLNGLIAAKCSFDAEEFERVMSPMLKALANMNIPVPDKCD